MGRQCKITDAHNHRYLIHEEYDNPDEFNVNDPPGVYKDADKNSGYLRAYRETGSGKDDANIGDANSTVIKYLIGVAVSTDGKLLSGKTGVPCVPSATRTIPSK